MSPMEVRQCESCDVSFGNAEISYCHDCDCFSCGGCWYRQGPHKPGKVARDGLAHEPSDCDVMEALKSILNSSANKEAPSPSHRGRGYHLV